MSIAAYQRTALSTETPVSTEHRAFVEVTRRLIDSGKADVPVARRMEALYDNLRLWLILTADLAEEDNPFPNDLKARLISLGIWVERYTASAIKGDKPMQPLIDVNREIAAGLSQVSAAKPAAQVPA